MNPAKRLIKASFNLMGLNVSRISRGPSATPRLDHLYLKYKGNTMLSREGYLTNLALAATVTTPGCVIECGVWKGGSSAGMAEVLGPDREYFLFDSFQGHVDPQPIDGPAAFAWQADKTGAWYFNNAIVGTEDADAAMKKAGAKKYRLVKGWFEDTLATFTPPSPIAVLRVDCDWYASAMTCLRALFPYVADDGILIADGYPDWDGYARALHEYLAGYEGVARIKQFKGGLYYVVKGARNWEDTAVST
jgi:O-methyltransferase